MATAKAETPRSARRRARFAEVLAAAWDIAHEDGLGAVTLHEVARRVGLRQPSLYAYVDSKSGLYDAMFAQAAQALLDEITTGDYAPDPRRAIVQISRAIVEFSTVDPARAQLLFQHTVPGFEPSPDSYAIAIRFMAWIVGRLAAAGVHDPADVDIYTALTGGLGSQQIANDPGGDRWTRHIETVLGMFLEHIDRRDHAESSPNHDPTAPTEHSP